MKRQSSAWWIRASIFVGVIAVAAVLAGTSFAWNERDAGSRGHGFSARSLKGSYGFNSSFSMFVATGPNQPVVPALPFASMGRIFFDGEGGCTVSSIGNVNGQSIPSTSSSCAYSINPDGTGTSVAVFPGTPIADPIPIAFVITDGGDELRAVFTQFIVGTFTARRQ
jgi:hypothetical protein